MTTSPQVVQPPRIPLGVGIKYRDGDLVTGSLWQKWRTPMAGATLQTVGVPGQRITVVISTPAGQTRRVPVRKEQSARTAAWVVAFNAWREATQST
ncbi:hypothetical protein [Streptacidiphilus sp. PAMC 29251]